MHFIFVFVYVGALCFDSRGKETSVCAGDLLISLDNRFRRKDPIAVAHHLEVCRVSNRKDPVLQIGDGVVCPVTWIGKYDEQCKELKFYDEPDQTRDDVLINRLTMWQQCESGSIIKIYLSGAYQLDLKLKQYEKKSRSRNNFQQYKSRYVVEQKAQLKIDPITNKNRPDQLTGSLAPRRRASRRNQLLGMEPSYQLGRVGSDHK